MTSNHVSGNLFLRENLRQILTRKWNSHERDGFCVLRQKSINKLELKTNDSDESLKKMRSSLVLVQTVSLKRGH